MMVHDPSLKLEIDEIHSQIERIKALAREQQRVQSNGSPSQEDKLGPVSLDLVDESAQTARQVGEDKQYAELLQ